MTQVLLRENKIKKIRTGVYSLPTWSEAYSKPHKRIVESVLLNSEELTVALKVIARKSELSVKNTWKILQKLLSEGRVWKVDHGFYALRDEEI